MAPKPHREHTMKTKLLKILIIATVGLAPALLLAQYNLDWWTVDGGGGTSTGGAFSVTGTIGQPDAGRMSGGNFQVTGGFWSLISVVQTSGAPHLTIINTGTNAVKVCWPNPSTGWGLQQNTNVATTNWISSQLLPVIEGANKCVIVTPPTGNLFFRLAK
jgi:hypothetical protein